MNTNKFSHHKIELIKKNGRRINYDDMEFIKKLIGVDDIYEHANSIENFELKKVHIPDFRALLYFDKDNIDWEEKDAGKKLPLLKNWGNELNPLTKINLGYCEKTNLHSVCLEFLLINLRLDNLDKKMTDKEKKQYEFKLIIQNKRMRNVISDLLKNEVNI